MNRRISEKDALGSVTRFEYDPNGNLTKRVLPSNEEILYEYDELNRLIQKTISASRFTNDASRITTYIYDPNGNLIALKDENSRIINEYDALNRLIKTVQVLRFADHESRSTISYVYDASGNRITMTLNGKEEAYYSYNPLNQIEQIRKGSHLFKYTYDALGRRASLEYPNSLTTTYSYDKLSRLIQISHASRVISYAYNRIGNKTKSVENDITKRYTYDRIGQLIGEEFQGQEVIKRTYSLDRMGNRTEVIEGINDRQTYTKMGKMEGKMGTATIYRN